MGYRYYRGCYIGNGAFREETERLVNQFGYNYEQLEEIEAEVFRTVAEDL